jgi:hypothetical protein
VLHVLTASGFARPADFAPPPIVDRSHVRFGERRACFVAALYHQDASNARDSAACAFFRFLPHGRHPQ